MAEAFNVVVHRDRVGLHNLPAAEDLLALECLVQGFFDLPVALLSCPQVLGGLVLDLPGFLNPGLRSIALSSQGGHVVVLLLNPPGEIHGLIIIAGDLLLLALPVPT